MRLQATRRLILLPNWLTLHMDVGRTLQCTVSARGMGASFHLYDRFEHKATWHQQTFAVLKAWHDGSRLISPLLAHLLVFSSRRSLKFNANDRRDPQLYRFCPFFYWLRSSDDTFSLALEKCVLLSNVWEYVLLLIGCQRRIEGHVCIWFGQPLGASTSLSTL